MDQPGAPTLRFKSVPFPTRSIPFRQYPYLFEATGILAHPFAHAVSPGDPAALELVEYSDRPAGALQRRTSMWPCICPSSPGPECGAQKIL